MKLRYHIFVHVPLVSNVVQSPESVGLVASRHVVIVLHVLNVPAYGNIPAVPADKLISVPLVPSKFAVVLSKSFNSP